MSKRKCFVIMPFSSTDSTSSQSWTSIYENIIKPTVEKSGDFECERSKATRGNMIKDIMNALNDSDLVIADITDHNANVCYELGIRHGLKIGTILLAQKREFLNIFDLHNYGSHVYNWKTKPGKKKMIEKIEELIEDFINNPQKVDSPVQDFLQNKPSYVGASPSEIKNILEYDSRNNPQILIPKKHLSGKLAVGLILLGNSSAGISMRELVTQVSKNWKRVKSSDLSPILSQQMSGMVLKEGTSGNYIYRLSNMGRRQILETVKLMKNS